MIPLLGSANLQFFRKNGKKRPEMIPKKGSLVIPLLGLLVVKGWYI